MGNNSQSRKWALVINNPLEAGLDHTAIAKLLSLFSPAYYCMADEIATTGTYHTHVFFYAPSPARFPTVKHRFPTAHIEKAYGNVQGQPGLHSERGPLGGYGQGGNFGAWDIRGMGGDTPGEFRETPGDVPPCPEYPGGADHHGNH